MQFFVRRNITHKLRLNITYSLFGVHGNNHTLESADCRTLFQSKENSQLEIRFASKNSWALPHESNIRNTPTISKIVPNQKQTMWKCYSTNELEDRFIDHLLRHVTSSGFWWNKAIRPYGPYMGHKGDDCIATMSIFENRVWGLNFLPLGQLLAVSSDFAFIFSYLLWFGR